MSVLEDAARAAEARKAAAIGETINAEIKSPTHLQRAAVFSGFDLDIQELDETAERAGYWFAQLAASGDLALRDVFSTCWVDALLVGIMIGKNG